ncbi:MAG: YbhB/YbcL family Raf kinase inhibitor-like protein [Polyangiales bacterium]
MKVHSQSFDDGAFMPVKYAFGKRSAEGKIDLSDNENPHLAWSDLPSGTKSIAILCIDVDVPTKPDDVNQEGRTVPADLPRAEFAHWVLIDVPPDAEIEEGTHSREVTARGKDGPDGPLGTRHGINDYTSWFAGDADMAGEYFGYDGGCPPFNDSIIHRYRFTVFALDTDSLPVNGSFTADDVRRAMEGHVLAEASLTGKYTINPDAREP